MKQESRDSIFLSRRAILLCGPASVAAALGQQSPVVIYAREDWYQNRPEPERKQTGILRERSPDNGPAGRQALRFTMQLHDGSPVPVYAAGAVDRLMPFAGRRVITSAKVVDLRAEGYGVELWIGTIQLVR